MSGEGSFLPGRVDLTPNAGADTWNCRAFRVAPTLLSCDGMATTRAFKNLDAWQQAMNLVEHCYQLTTHFPREEMYGLTSQLRRAAVSIPSNVAEGCCRRNTKVYANHIAISLGSHAELETCLELAFRLGFLPSKERAALEQRVDSVGRLLSGLHRSLEEKIAREEAQKTARHT
jgi:four helix bundle protein